MGIPNFYGQQNAFREVEDICPCCGKSQNLKKLSVTSNTDKLFFLGIGVPLFFHYACFSFVALTLATLIYSIFMTLFHIMGEECVANNGSNRQINVEYCGDSWKVRHSFGNSVIKEYA